jgi:hypothetical protein
MNRSTNRTLGLRLLGTTVLAGGLGLLVLAGRASADEPPAHPHRPPPAAYTACDGKASGDACTVQFHDKTVSGTCDTFPGDSSLSCKRAAPGGVHRE